jgi:hypothetical protein
MSSKSEEETAWYVSILRLLKKAQVPFLIGGAYALWKYTGVRRPTKDLDVFLRSEDLVRALKVIEEAGWQTEITARHWIGKAFHKTYLIDFIVGLANGIGQVDDSWFEKPPRASLFGLTVPIVGLEDMIWSKAFVMERDRFDGADIAHLFLEHGKNLDWPRLRERFSAHEEVLLSHLLLFRYIYPSSRHIIPARVLQSLWNISQKNGFVPSRLCRGTLFSRTQYVADVERHGYEDARLPPHGALTAQQILE